MRLLYTVYEQVTKKRKNSTEEDTIQTQKHPRLGVNDQENPKEQTSTDNRGCCTSPEGDQGDENSSPDENEQSAREPKKECDESVGEKLVKETNEEGTSEDDEKLSSSHTKNTKTSATNNFKPKLTEKESVKNIMSGKKSVTPKSLHEDGGKFFSSNFYKRKAAFQADIGGDCPIDMTKKAMKKHKELSAKKIGKEQTVVNGTHFPGYEFTD